jgi:hypothetical protein
MVNLPAPDRAYEVDTPGESRYLRFTMSRTAPIPRATSIIATLA